MTPVSKHTLKEIIDKPALRQLAGGHSFERGEDYFNNRRVWSLAEYDGKITAKVRGTYEYRVSLWIEDNKIAYDCTCPVGRDGEFCKHCVAVGLVWLAQQGPDETARCKSKKPSVTMDDVQTYLENQDKKRLVDMIMEQAMKDNRLREHLLMKTAKKGHKGLDLAAFCAVIDNAIDIDDFIDYHSAYDYARGVDDAIDSIEELLKEGYASEVIELTEYALEAVENAMGFIDDSDGYMGGILERLQDTHYAVCKKAKPDPEDLAKRLFEWELRTEWDTFYGAAATYANILGEKGLAVYRKLAEAKWELVPLLDPSKKDSERYGHRFRLTSIMETLAKESGDIEALVNIKSRDLSSAYSFLQIAEIYKHAKKYDQALEWAEKGVKAFPDRTDSRLREFLADEYHRRNRHNEAMALVWANFTDSPRLDQYKKLKTHSDRIAQWQLWREKALVFLRESIVKTKKETAKNQWGWVSMADHSDLVIIFLWEKDIEAAWREAKDGGCSNNLWLELAVKRERDHPEDSLNIYQNQIEPTLANKNNEAYKEAIGFLRKVCSLMSQLGKESEFTQYLEKIRTVHKPKRNFMKLIDNTKWL